LKKHTQSDYL